MTTSFKELFRTNAHVFQINPETKTSWLPKGNSAIPIAFVTNEPEDSRGRELRLVGINEDGAKALDSSILLTTVFTKRSQKFGQWTDRAGIVWGLGFNSEDELDDFIGIFQKLQGDLLTAPTLSNVCQQPTRSSLVRSPQSIGITNQQQADILIRGGGQRFSQSGNENENGFSAQYSNTMLHSQQAVRRQQLGSYNEQDANMNGSSNGGVGGSSIVPRSLSCTNGINGENATDTSKVVSDTLVSNDGRQSIEQLRYENERLKQALEESSKNASIWQTELHNLRTNNVMLTKALEESKSHVEEWQHELNNLRLDKEGLKIKIQNFEKMKSETSREHEVEIEKYKDLVGTLEEELRQKKNDIRELEASMDKLDVNGDPMSERLCTSDDQKQKLDDINNKLEAKLIELTSVQKEFKHLLSDLIQQ